MIATTAVAADAMTVGLTMVLPVVCCCVVGVGVCEIDEYWRRVCIVITRSDAFPTSEADGKQGAASRTIKSNDAMRIRNRIVDARQGMQTERPVCGWGSRPAKSNSSTAGGRALPAHRSSQLPAPSFARVPACSGLLIIDSSISRVRRLSQLKELTEIDSIARTKQQAAPAFQSPNRAHRNQFIKRVKSGGRSACGWILFQSAYTGEQRLLKYT